MSLHTLLSQLNANPIFSIIPVGEQHLSIGDPATTDGRKELLNNAAVVQDMVCLDLDPEAKIHGDITSAHACLVLTLPWMLGVDSTGTPYFALVEEELPSHLSCDHGTWFSEVQNSEVFYKPQDDTVTVFLFNGRLLGDGINVTLREICDMDVFQTPWYDPDDRSGVLPARPNTLSVFAKLIAAHDATPKARGYKSSAFCFLWDNMFPEHPATQDASYNLLSWLRDRSFKSSPQRDENIIEPDVAEQLNKTIPQLPSVYEEHIVLVEDSAKTGHEALQRAALLAHMSRYITPEMKVTA